MLEENPTLEAKLLNQALREVDQGRELMLALGRKTAHEKVASFLMMMVRQIDPFAGGDGVTAFDLPLARAEIGDFLGLTIGTVSRELTRLRRAGAIQISSHRHIDILDLSPMRRLNGKPTYMTCWQPLCPFPSAPGPAVVSSPWMRGCDLSRSFSAP